MRWLSVQELEHLCGIPERTARRAMSRAAIGKPWNKTTLIVREVECQQGGKGGVRYEVRADSLPPEFQEALKASPKALPAPLEGKPAIRTVRSAVLSRVRQHPKNSVARADEIRRIAKEGVLNPKTLRQEPVAEDTIRRWEREEEERGLAALARKERSDAGKTHVIVSKKWDAQVPFDDEKKLEIRNALKIYVRSLWANGFKSGGILFRAKIDLETRTREAGFEPPAGLCKVPDHFVKMEREKFAEIHTKRTDRKQWEDNRPRSSRSYAALRFNQYWFGDVHKVDVIHRESDEYQRHAAFITWMDAATLRAHIDVVILPKGKGIRNAHVIASLLRAMKSMGVPESLYIDNGSEYYNAEFLEDLLKLRCGDDRQVIVHSIPHNPQGKAVIEGFFGNFEQNFLAPTPGYIGGNRMASKIAHGGRKPISWPLDEKAFFDHVANLLHIYHNTPQKGKILKGLSPFEAYQKKIDEGGERIEIDEAAFVVAFSELISRPKDRGSIHYGGKEWTCDELDKHPGSHFLVRVPKYDQWDRLPIYDEKETLVGWASPKKVFAFDDPEGAKDSLRRKGLAALGISTLAENIHSIDPIADAQQIAALLPGSPTAPSGGTVTPSDAAREIVAGLKESPADKEARQKSARLEKFEAQRAQNARIMENLKAKSA